MKRSLPIYVIALLIIALFFLIPICSNVYAEPIKAKIISNGKVVLLNSDGTWEYENTPKTQNLRLPEKREFKHPPFSESGEFIYEKRYNKFTKQTNVTLFLQGVRTTTVDLDAFNFLISYSYPEKTLTIPEYVHLIFLAISSDWKFLRTKSGILLIDDVPFQLDNLERSSDISDGYVSEALSKSITLNQFLTMITRKD